MKGFFAAILLFCTSGTLLAQQQNSANRRNGFAKKLAQRNARDTVELQQDTIALIGRIENGRLAPIMGTWLLQRLNGLQVADKSSLHLSRKPAIMAVTIYDTLVSTETTNGKTIKVTKILSRSFAPADSTNTLVQGEQLAVPQRPYISFYGLNETFSGFTGCNKMAGRYNLKLPNTLKVIQAAPSTMMPCIGDYNETMFIDALTTVVTFKVKDDVLELLDKDKVVMVFKRQ